MLKDMLFCQPLKGQTTGNDIFIKVDAFFKGVGFSWDNCIGVCTDGAAAMTGKNIGFQSIVKSATNTSDTFTYCMIHREALVAKKMSTDLHEVLSVAIKIIIYIKSNALNSRLFCNLCQDMDSEYQSLLLHTVVRWLSKGRSLHHLVDLKEEVIFLSGKNLPLETWHAVATSCFFRHSRTRQHYDIVEAV